MTRYDKLLKEITKGHNMDKKVNSVFNDWTPHNIRRLVIGVDKAIVQYHTTGGRFDRLVYVVDYSSIVERDYGLFVEGDKSIKPLIGVLVDGRVCSAVEEIVLACQNYPQDLYTFDFNLDKLTQQSRGNSADVFLNRFTRLSRVYMVNASVDALAEIVKSDTDPCKLLYNMVKNRCQVSVIAECNKEWFRGNSKFWNSKTYLMDKVDGTLYNRLKSVEDKFDEHLKAVKSEQEHSDRLNKIADKNLSDIPKIYESILSIHSGVTSFLSQIGLVSKARYGSFLLPSSVALMYKKASAPAEAKIACVNWGSIETVMKSSAPDLLPLLGIIYTLVNKGKLDMEQGHPALHEQYKKDTLYSDVESCKVFRHLAILLLDVYVDSVFVGLVKCLAPERVKHASKNYENWGFEGIEGLSFTEATSKNANLVIDNGYLYEVLSSLGVQHIPVERQSKLDKARQAGVALQFLQMYEDMLGARR